MLVLRMSSHPPHHSWLLMKNSVHAMAVFNEACQLSFVSTSSFLVGQPRLAESHLHQSKGVFRQTSYPRFPMLRSVQLSLLYVLLHALHNLHALQGRLA